MAIATLPGLRGLNSAARKSKAVGIDDACAGIARVMRYRWNRAGGFLLLNCPERSNLAASAAIAASFHCLRDGCIMPPLFRAAEAP
jgi:hypothetical protein